MTTTQPQQTPSTSRAPPLQQTGAAALTEHDQVKARYRDLTAEMWAPKPIAATRYKALSQERARICARYEELTAIIGDFG